MSAIELFAKKVVEVEVGRKSFSVKKIEGTLGLKEASDGIAMGWGSCWGQLWDQPIPTYVLCT